VKIFSFHLSLWPTTADQCPKLEPREEHTILSHSGRLVKSESIGAFESGDFSERELGQEFLSLCVSTDRDGNLFDNEVVVLCSDEGFSDTGVVWVREDFLG
jgi:hypothetical protein